MVYNLPRVIVTDVIGYTPSIPADDQVFGYVLECTKGEPNEAVLVRSPEELYQKFKYKINGHWGVGGQAVYMVRAACDVVNGGTAPGKASQILLDTSGTQLSVMQLEAKQKGSYPITISIQENTTTGNNIIIEEEGYAPEYYIGVSTIEEMVDRINRESEIVTAYFYVCPTESPTCSNGSWATTYNSETEIVKEGSGLLTEILPGTVLGVLPENGDADLYVAGTDGTVHSTPAYSAQLPNANAPTAHSKALTALQTVTISGVVCLQVTEDTQATVHAKYVEHVDAMNTEYEHGWRFAVLGAPDGASKGEIVSTAVGFNRNSIVFVGQGVTDLNGDIYTPTEATQIVAGKISATNYQDTVWGGHKSKILGILQQNGTIEKFVADITPLPGDGVGGFATKENLIEYNEAGVITFLELPDGIRIREGLTTVQNPAEVAEDELAVVRIVRHAKYLAYNRAFEMLGQNMTSTYKVDLEEYIKSGFEEMKNIDKSIIDIPESGLSAYNINVSLIPRTVQKPGTISVTISITPVHAARTIQITIVVM
jgi:hypothetical protein